MKQRKNSINKRQILQNWKKYKNIDKFLKNLARVFFIIGIVFLIALLIGDFFGKKIFFANDDYDIKIKIVFLSFFCLKYFFTTMLFYPLVLGNKIDNFFNFFYWKDFNENSFEDSKFNYYLNLLKKGKKLLKIKFFFSLFYLLIFGLIWLFYFFIF